MASNILHFVNLRVNEFVVIRACPLTMVLQLESQPCINSPSCRPLQAQFHVDCLLLLVREPGIYMLETQTGNFCHAIPNRILSTCYEMFARHAFTPVQIDVHVNTETRVSCMRAFEKFVQAFSESISKTK